MLLHDVRVFTKRYMRGGQLYLGFLFEVQDASQTANGGGPLIDGERIAIHFDHDRSGGAQLDAQDMRLVVTHRWQSGGGSDITGIQSVWSTGTGAPGVCGGGPRWLDVADPAGYAVAARSDFPGGYRVELEVRASGIGGVAADFGVSFQVVNDWGVMGSPNSSGNSFPSTLPYTTLDNAVNGCNDSWRVPANWGTGFFSAAGGDVTISRMPVFWNSDDIVPSACGAPGYTYYPANPCKLTLQATIHSSFATPQTRNLVFMWADHGASPSTWRTIGIKKNVAIGAMGTAVASSDPWASVPTGLPNHPCVRVYILPPAFQASFDEAAILAISNAGQLAAMEAAYGVQTQQWAQKNISAASAGQVCPNAQCRVSARDDGFGRDLAATFARTLARPFEVQELVAQERPSRDTTPRIFLPPTDRKILGPDNAIVQVQAWGYGDPGPEDSLKYVLAEPLGGLVQAIPIKLLEEKQGQWPLQFTVGNPGRYERTVFLTLDREMPAGFPGGFEVKIDFGRERMKPNEERVVKAMVTRTDRPIAAGPDTAPKPGGGGEKSCGLGKSGAIVALLGLALLGLARRSWMRE
ncbi:MAG TPA: hypothetical protein VFQ39_16795, partial [Longimicrobium sp.]|nr:hypothetical protein [Longimicrobium sp.]